MALKVMYGVEQGNTVPYPSLFDDVRRNHGFVDLRGRPELVDSVPEAAESPALRTLLLNMAASNSRLMSLGCDLGTRMREQKRRRIQFCAGGYLQMALLPLTAPDRSRLHRIASSAAAQLEVDITDDAWTVDFALCRTHFKFAELIESETLWVWFDAAAYTSESSRNSRERLIKSLSKGLNDC